MGIDRNYRIFGKLSDSQVFYGWKMFTNFTILVYRRRHTKSAIFWKGRKKEAEQVYSKNTIAYSLSKISF